MAAQWLPETWIGDNPVGLGLLAWLGTYVGLLVVAGGLLLLLVSYVRQGRT